MAQSDRECTANLPALVRDLSVDHADTGDPAGQGCDFDHGPLFGWQ